MKIIFQFIVILLTIGSVQGQSNIYFLTPDTALLTHIDTLDVIVTIEHLDMKNENTSDITVDWWLTIDVPQVLDPNSNIMVNAWDVKVCDEVLCHNEPMGQTLIPPANKPYDWHFQVSPVEATEFAWTAGTGTCALNVRNIDAPNEVHTKTLTFTVSDVVGINDYTIARVNVFPNPTTNSVNIQLEKNDNLNRAIITNLNGQILKEMNIEDQTAISFDLTDLSTGLYHVRLSNDAGLIMSSQLIEKK